jgi:hypothetical protein
MTWPILDGDGFGPKSASKRHENGPRRDLRGPFRLVAGAGFGFYADITDSFNSDLQQSISDQLQIIVPHRETIEQAKGMLMVNYQLNADAAFGILKWRSQEHNVKLATIGAKLVTDLPALLRGHPALRAPVDHYLMTLTQPDGAP